MRQFLTSDTSPFPDRFGNGSNGALTISSNTTEAPTDASCSGTSGTTTLSATNGSFAANQLILIHQTRGTGAGNWELNKISSYTAGTITTSYALQNTYTDSGASQAQVRVLLQYSSVTINSGITYTAKAWDGDVGGILAYLCNGLTTVTGTISANGKGFRGGGADIQGESHNAQPSTTHQTGANAGGGGSCNAANNENAGSGGGYGTGGSAGTGISGTYTGGGTYGVANLTSLHLGSGGGGSHAGEQPGEAGGGTILIISKTITVTGSVISNGASNGNESQIYGLGGSGSGGSILLKGQVLTLGTTLATTTGGATSSNSGAGGDGGAGGVGRIHADYSSTISGTTNPTLDSSQDSIFTDRGGGAFFGLM